MKRLTATRFARDLGVLYQAGAVGGLSDRELLGQFRPGAGDEAERAFEAIVGRHGSMVRGVCRRVGLDEQAAEDAFQATFLVLAMRAGSIRRVDSLASWLHGVAARISRRVRATSYRKNSPEIDSMAPVADCGSSVEEDLLAHELRGVLDEEIERLPAVYRRAVVLCYLEGKTQDAAALELGWTKGTVSGRLARAKEILRGRLVRRGFGPSAGLAGAIITDGHAGAAVPAHLASLAVRAGLSAVLGRAELAAASGSAALLAHGLLRTMLLGKVAAAVAVVVCVAIFATALARTAGGPGRSGEVRTNGASAAGRTQAAAPGPRDTRAERLPAHARARLGTTRLRHDTNVAHVAFSPNGDTLASVGWDGTLRFWDTAAGEPWARLPRIEGERTERSVAYSPDGKTLAVGHDSFVQLLDPVTGRESFRSEPLKGGVRELLFSPDGKTLAAASSESNPAVRLWDVATGRIGKTLVIDEAQIFNGRPMSFSPDGKRLAVGTQASRNPPGKPESIVAIWDIESNSKPLVIRNVLGHSLISVVFVPAGDLILTAGSDMRSPPARLAWIPRVHHTLRSGPGTRGQASRSAASSSGTCGGIVPWPWPATARRWSRCTPRT